METKVELWAMDVMHFTKEEKQYLLDLSRRAIEEYLKNKNILEEIPPFEKVLQKAACFVTLKINNHLRGCVGHLLAFQPLYKDVIENSINAAFFDSRFRPLTSEEFKDVKISISILSTPKEFKFKTKEELIAKLEKEKPGVILVSGHAKATYLPAVWEEVKNAEEFMCSLALKAGIYAFDWQVPEKVRIFLYTAVTL